jgi:hypothetical protein
VGTVRFREDVSVELSKFMRSHPGKTPRTLKARYRDAMDWQRQNSAAYHFANS